MNMDARIETKNRPMYGCHSDLDELRGRPSLPCEYSDPYDEKGCEGCENRKPKVEE